jgi:uncharacterized iron-regulated membrane protein
MIRHFFVWLHRYFGLAMTIFLVLVGLTGSLLAFKSELEHVITPQLFATAKPGAVPLDFSAIADRAESLVPHAHIAGVYLGEPDQVSVSMTPHKDASGKPYVLGFDQLLLDPWTGNELGR